MVMDATQPQQPSPQSVGREFVRQYYTLLNKAPNHLHRFYNNNSSFIHGESTLVVGQKNIHSRIQQLNFHDCHAKISQVDAQATLGNGVVVQVTGELSNDGQPMRRFTQTFVLAAQSPKKYYVHNDIFRYQDLYSDEENDGESRSENDEELHEQQPVSSNEQSPTQVVATIVEQQQQPQQQLQGPVVPAATTAVIQQASSSQQQQAPIYYTLPTNAGGRSMQVLAAAPRAAGLPLNAQYASAAPQQVQATPTAATAAQLNGVVNHDDLLSAASSMHTQQQTLVAQNASPPGVVAPVAVASSAVLAQQTLTAGLPVVNATAAAIPQNVATSGFQPTPLLPHAQPQLLQQQPQQQQQPLQSSQASIMLQPQTVASNDDDVGISNTVTIINDTSSRATSSSVAPAIESVAPIIDDFKTINEQQQQEKYEAAKQQHEPKTYANLFKPSSSSPSGFVNAAMQQQQQLQQQQSSTNAAVYQPSTSSSISTATFSQSNTTTSSSSVYNNNRSDSMMRMVDNTSQGQGGPLPQRSNAMRMNKDFDQRRTSNAQQFGDNQQLFLGNVPHHATEEELKTLFSRFGSVLELRIHSKPGNKLPPGVRNPLNYGFITYEDPESVQNCLANCPLYFPENSPDAQKLNVEEKKPRQTRPNDMAPRQSMGNMNNNSMGNPQRNNMTGGPVSRSLSNTGGMMRNNTNASGNTMQRGTSGGPRIGPGGGFNRNDNRGPPPTGGPQARGGNGGSNNSAQSGGGSYGGRR